MTVLDPHTMAEVAADAQTLGEIMFRGNIVMKGYLKNAGRNCPGVRGRLVSTRDLAVLEPDRYVKIKDRSKDVIISGGEKHQLPGSGGCPLPPSGGDGLRSVARPDPKWGRRRSPSSSSRAASR